MPAADLAPLQSQQASQHTRTGKGAPKVQPIETLHDRQIGGRYRARLIINAAAADLQNFLLPGNRQIVLTVDHRFALSNPALVSAPSKKSFSSVSSPILACSDFTSTAGAAVAGLPAPHTSEAPPSRWAVVPAGSSVHGLSCSRQSSPLSGRNSTYGPVQICGAGSVRGAS